MEHWCPGEGLTLNGLWARTLRLILNQSLTQTQLHSICIFSCISPQRPLEAAEIQNYHFFLNFQYTFFLKKNLCIGAMVLDSKSYWICISELFWWFYSDFQLSYRILTLDCCLGRGCTIFVMLLPQSVSQNSIFNNYQSSSG